MSYDADDLCMCTEPNMKRNGNGNDEGELWEEKKKPSAGFRVQDSCQSPADNYSLPSDNQKFVEFLRVLALYGGA